MNRTFASTCFIAGAAFLPGCDDRSQSATTPGRSSANSNSATGSTAFPPLPESKLIEATYAALGVLIPPLTVRVRRGSLNIAGFPVESKQAIAMWKKLRELTDATGFYPMVFRDDNHLQKDILSELDDGSDPAEILRLAQDVNVPEWFAGRMNEVMGDTAESGYEGPPREPGATCKATTKFTVPFDILTGRPVEGVFILLVPTRQGYEVPAYLGFGGWNECPDPVEHVAILKYWHESYGAEPVTFAGDTLELLVPAAVQSEEGAMALAMEQYFYCMDIVDQGTGSIDALADSLRGSSIWFFWWD